MDLGSTVHRLLPVVRANFLQERWICFISSKTAVCRVTDSRTFARELAVRSPRTGDRPPERLLLVASQAALAAEPPLEENKGWHAAPKFADFP